jgi:putative hydrolase of the HAD superfamily
MTTSLSAVPLPEKAVVVFDLDDTLYPERDFVRSGFRAVANVVRNGRAEEVYERLLELYDGRERDPFAVVLSEHRLSIEKDLLVRAYREHLPCLTLGEGTYRLLTNLRAAGHSIGVLTDGRSITQRNKIRALELERWVEAVLISEEFGSEKPAERNYRYFEQLFPGRALVYVGDNLSKDFVAPNRLGWQTVCVLDGGQNVHPQNIDRVPFEAMPQFWIERLA